MKLSQLKNGEQRMPALKKDSIRNVMFLYENQDRRKERIEQNSGIKNRAEKHSALFRPYHLTKSLIFTIYSAKMDFFIMLQYNRTATLKFEVLETENENESGTAGLPGGDDSTINRE